VCPTSLAWCLTPKLAKKRKNDASARPARKHVMVPDRKAMPVKVPTSSKSVGAASSKGAVVKIAHAKAVPRANVVPGVDVPSKVGASSWAVVPKPTTTVSALKARVLRGEVECGSVPSAERKTSKN
jgi:hypothetical protein